MNSKLHYPPFDYQLKKEGSSTFIFDVIRKKYLKVTPEEWVRQHIIHFLIQYKNYPKNLFSSEYGIKYNQLQKRYDLVILNPAGKPFLLIECKAPTVKLTEATFRQAATYNQVLQAPYMAISNGLDTYIASINFEEKTSQLIGDYPEWNF